MKFSKKQLDLLWPTMSEELKEQIYAIAIKGLAALTAEVGYTLTEKSGEAVSRTVVKPRNKMITRKRHRDIKIHDRVFKDPEAIANFYKDTRTRVSQIIRQFGIENIEDHFRKVPETMIRKNDATFVRGV